MKKGMLLATLGVFGMLNPASLFNPKPKRTRPRPPPYLPKGTMGRLHRSEGMTGKRPRGRGYGAIRPRIPNVSAIPEGYSTAHYANGNNLRRAEARGVHRT